MTVKPDAQRRALAHQAHLKRGDPMQRAARLISLGAALIASSCMHGEAQDSPSKPAYREHESVQAAPPAPPAPARAQPENLLNGMAQDLGRRLGVKESALQVLSVQPVMWNDSSLGCPQPERAYLPAQTPGMRVVFQHQGKTYQYHGSERGDFVYCEHPAVSGLDEK
jgi:hypothetical protein